MEIWKDIENYEGLYQVSNLGNVKSLKTNKNLYYSRSTRTKNYLKVILVKNGTRKSYYIHRLVADAFIPNFENKPIVNHKDYNPMNNKVDNLEWCTYKENNNYGTRNLKILATSILNAIKEQYDNQEIIETAEKLKELLNKI